MGRSVNSPRYNGFVCTRSTRLRRFVVLYHPRTDVNRKSQKSTAYMRKQLGGIDRFLLTSTYRMGLHTEWVYRLNAVAGLRVRQSGDALSMVPGGVDVILSSGALSDWAVGQRVCGSMPSVGHRGPADRNGCDCVGGVARKLWRPRSSGG
jgi:hypothetical protein